MNKLTTEKRVAVVKALVEGCSMRATARMTGVARQTINDLLLDLGTVCATYQHRTLRNLKLNRLECDEIWAFVHCKAKNVKPRFEGVFGYGDVWTWTAVDVETKLVPCWLVSSRDGGAATAFIGDLASRLTHKVQLTTDGLKAYLTAVEDGFGCEIDYAQVVKLYGTAATVSDAAHHRYSPAHCTGITKTPITGEPDMDLAGTSYVERQNLSMRMGMRRFTRLTNGFSKKVANHEAMVALYFMHYNFARQHMTLRTSPAMAAGVSDHLWEVEEIVALLDSEPLVNVVNGGTSN